MSESVTQSVKLFHLAIYHLKSMFNFSQILVVFSLTPSASHCAAVCVQTTLRPAGPVTERQVDARKLETCAFSFLLLLHFDHHLQNCCFINYYLSHSLRTQPTFCCLKSLCGSKRLTAVCILYVAVFATMQFMPLFD